MRNSVTLLFLTFFLSYNSNGQIFCPADVTTSCFSDLSLTECGNATVVSGNYHQNQVKYEDDRQINACNEGEVFRKFYLDIDYNNAYTPGEPSCTQLITLTYEALPLNLQFPSEVTLNCLDDLPNQTPTWSSHPCDLVGFTYEDEVFDFENGACQKIVRTFQVINWCEYDASSNEGIYTGIQIIKIVDNEAPEIDNCEDVIIDAVANCAAEVILTNSATDVGDCPSGRLQWTLSVDLWGDGTEDLFYGPNEPQPFRLDKVDSGEEVSVTLPENITISNNKLVWKVTDGCGNVRSCSNRFEVKDNKPPTPYCKNFLSATLNGADGGQLVIPVSLFDNGGWDNCSSPEELTLSFSTNVEDTERVIECGEIGFQFFRVYVTDAAGNQSFCEVFMFVLDNGSCSGKFEPIGKIYTRLGQAVENVTTYLMENDEIISQSSTDQDGLFSFGEQNLMDIYSAKAVKHEDPMLGVDLVDYQMMVDASLGKIGYDKLTKIAADLNEDGKFDVSDLKQFRDVFTGEAELLAEESLKFIPIIPLSENDTETAEFDSEMSIMEYRNGFNFCQVKKGDLTGTELTASPEANNQVIDLSFVIENDRVVISNPEMVETGFFSIDLLVNESEISNQVKSSTAYESGNITRLLNLNQESVTLNPNDINVSVTYYSSEEADHILKSVVSDVAFMNQNHNAIADINWTIIDKRDLDVSDNISADNIDVYPTIFQNEITITGSNILKVEMRSVNGQVVKIQSGNATDRVILELNESVGSGIYFLNVESESGTKIIKVVK